MIQKICQLLKDELLDNGYEYGKDGCEVIEITDSVVIGEKPEFILSRTVIR